MSSAKNEEWGGGTGVQGGREGVNWSLGACQHVKVSPGSSKAPLEVNSMNLRSVRVVE